MRRHSLSVRQRRQIAPPETSAPPPPPPPPGTYTEPTFASTGPRFSPTSTQPGQTFVIDFGTPSGLVFNRVHFTGNIIVGCEDSSTWVPPKFFDCNFDGDLTFNCPRYSGVCEVGWCRTQKIVTGFRKNASLDFGTGLYYHHSSARASADDPMHFEEPRYLHIEHVYAQQYGAPTASDHMDGCQIRGMAPGAVTATDHRIDIYELSIDTGTLGVGRSSVMMWESAYTTQVHHLTAQGLWLRGSAPQGLFVDPLHVAPPTCLVDGLRMEGTQTVHPSGNYYRNKPTEPPPSGTNEPNHGVHFTDARWIGDGSLMANLP